ncbi:MAG: hypothetical protein LBR21_09360 [Propionibacteriaceae bacterium]|nr:hypothetical protein [Propionibacteriaceae bacterium]
MLDVDSEVIRQWQKEALESLSQVPIQEAPDGWREKLHAAVGGLMYVGFSKECDCLLTVSSGGRGLWDLQTGEKIARQYEPEGTELDERFLTCVGIGPVAGEVISVAGLCGGGLPTVSNKGEELSLASPHYPIHDVIFEYPWVRDPVLRRESCIVYRGFVKHYGFSYSGDYFVVVDEDVHVWERL